MPRHVEIEIAEYTARYGKLKLTRDHRGLVLSISAAVLAEELVRHQTVALLLGQRIGSQEFFVEPAERGRLKQALIRVGYPVEDLAGYRQGDPLEIILRRETRGGLSFRLRDYQREAAESFYAAGTARGGFRRNCKIGYSAFGSSARYSFWCGSLCGHGSTLVFEKVNAEWRNARKRGGWIS